MLGCFSLIVCLSLKAWAATNPPKSCHDNATLGKNGNTIPCIFVNIDPIDEGLGNLVTRDDSAENILNRMNLWCSSRC